MRAASLAAAVMLSLALGASASADGHARVSSAIDREQITVGDPIALSVTVELAPGWQVTDPGVRRSLGQLEVLETEPALQTRLPGGATRIVFRYLVSAYRVGDQTVPAVTVSLSGPRGEAATAETTAHLVRVRSVILPDEDPADIKPLKPQLAVPGLPGSDVLRRLFAGLAAAAVLVAALVAALFARRPGERSADGLTPAGRALGELEALAALGLPEKGRSSEHYEQLTRILRRYVAAQYRLPASERTPRELRAEMERAGVDQQQRATIFEILNEGELVRFHGGRSYPAHARSALGSALAAMRRAAAAEQYAMAAIRPEP